MKQKLVTFLTFLAFFFMLGAGDSYADTNETPTDNQIKDSIQAQFEKFKDVGVEVKDGVATLSGSTKTEKTRSAAVSLAANMPGVKSVVNQIVVKPDQNMSEYFDDAGITTMVKTKLLAQHGVPSTDITVTTVNGVVTLTGEVEHTSQAGLAEKVASEVHGVTKVENKLIVTGK